MSKKNIANAKIATRSKIGLETKAHVCNNNKAIPSDGPIAVVACCTARYIMMVAQAITAIPAITAFPIFT